MCAAVLAQAAGFESPESPSAVASGCAAFRLASRRTREAECVGLLRASLPRSLDDSQLTMAAPGGIRSGAEDDGSNAGGWRIRESEGVCKLGEVFKVRS